jgi:hypothetical protein
MDTKRFFLPEMQHPETETGHSAPTMLTTRVMTCCYLILILHTSFVNAKTGFKHKPLISLQIVQKTK